MYDLSHIEDCTQSFIFLTYKRNRQEHTVILVVLVFPTKNLGCFGDGGLITAKNKKIMNRYLN